MNKHEINPNLFKLFLNQQTIIDASAYAAWIDTLLYKFFKKGNQYHYVMEVRSEEGIKAQPLFGTFLDLLDLGEKFAQSEGIDADFGDVQTRINLNSPGDVELWKMGIAAIGILGFLVVLINGGGFEVSINKGEHKIGIKTEGALKKLSDFLNERKNRQMVEEVRTKLKGLKVKTSDELLSLIKATKK